MKILAIDPGPIDSAFVVYENKKILLKGIEENPLLLMRLRNAPFSPILQDVSLIVIETPMSYGMKVGRDVFECCVAVGRFMEACLFGAPVHRLGRKQVVLQLCHSARAKDGDVTRACIERVGPKGKKASPGPTYGVAYDEWAALGVAVAVDEMLAEGSFQPYEYDNGEVSIND